jgi:formylglycine-generating enzyme required for sulfatase activity
MIMNRQRLWSLLLSVFVVLVCIAGQSGFAEQILYVNNTQVNLRSGPTAATNNIITTVPQDTPVVILAQQGGWYRVRIPDGQEGWISRWVVISRETRSDSRGRGLSPPVDQGDAESLDPDVLAQMIFIPGGSAIIGSDENEIEFASKTWDVPRDVFVTEVPRERITFRGFYIDQYEVTNAQYKEFVDDTLYPPPPHWEKGLYPQNTENHPVTFVSWDDAQAYAQWAGKRLPTAEEWEIAARGLRGQTFPWGATFDSQQVNIDNIQEGTAPGGFYQDDVSMYDVYDMGGNVMEWTLTQYEGTKDFFILKGSSWRGKPYEARGANQTPGEAVYQLSHIGFRCVKSADR